MDGVFVKKAMKRVGICLMTVILFWCGSVVADRQTLRRELVRLHVVAASDSPEDQALKLRVKDAVVESLRSEMENLADAQQAKAYLQTQLPRICTLANYVLQEAGSADVAQVSLAVEEFGTRVYDTFTLPAGVYDALRITIGPGEGKNWWCVVFPTLCVSATAEGFEEAAQCGGFSSTLTNALEGTEGYELRFFLLDMLGRGENLLRSS